jgi:hypothetical protein
MMSHKVKILDYSTFRLNLSCTSPYNAVSILVLKGQHRQKFTT